MLASQSALSFLGYGRFLIKEVPAKGDIVVVVVVVVVIVGNGAVDFTSAEFSSNDEEENRDGEQDQPPQLRLRLRLFCHATASKVQDMGQTSSGITTFKADRGPRASPTVSNTKKENIAHDNTHIIGSDAINILQNPVIFFENRAIILALYSGFGLRVINLPKQACKKALLMDTVTQPSHAKGGNTIPKVTITDSWATTLNK